MTALAISHLTAFDDAARLLASGNATDGIPLTVHTLSDLRRALSPARWRQVGGSLEFAALRALLHEDPYTRRGFAKPHGYAGDAVLLDYIYGCASLPDAVTPVGRAIYEWCYRQSVAFACVRERRLRCARAIDVTARRVPNARVLSVACGHLREAQLSAALVGRELGELVALDHDMKALDVVNTSCAGLPVTCVQGTVGDLVKRRIDLGTFDLIYVAGLYDYLPDELARKLTAALYQLVCPGGELHIANFIQCWEAPYMEAAMEWYLLYRNPYQLLDLAADACCAAKTLDVDDQGVIAYLTLAR